jgi:TP901 family phage tail tape measure protein
MPVYLDVKSRLDTAAALLAAREAKAIFSRAGDDIGHGLGKSLSKALGAIDGSAARTALKGLQTEYAATAAAAEAASLRELRAIGAVEVAQKRLTELQAKHAADSSRVAKASNDLVYAQALSAKAIRDHADAAKAAEGAHKNLEATTASGAIAAGRAAQVWNGVGVVSVAGFGAAMLETTRKAGDFQQQMVKLHAAAGMPVQDLKTASDGILKLAGKVGYSAGELSDALFKISKYGYSAADGLKILDAAAQGANAEQIPLDETVNALSLSMHNFHAPADDANKVMSQMITAAGQSRGSLQEFAGSLDTIEPIAAQLGLSLGDVWGTLSQITRSGTSADQATEWMRNAARAFSGAQAPARQAMQQFGIDADEVSQHLGGPNGRGLAGTAQYLYDTLSRKIDPSTGLLNSGDMLQSARAMNDADQMMTKMSPHARELAEGLKNNTIGHVEYRKAVFASNEQDAVQLKQFQGLIDKVDGFSKRLTGGRQTVETLTQALNEVTGTMSGAQVVLSITGDKAGDTNRAIDAINKTTAEADGTVKGFNESQETLNAKMRDAKAAFGAAATEMGYSFVPAATAVANVAKDIGDTLARHPGIMHSVIDVLGTLGGAWLAFKALNIAETVLAPIATGLGAVIAGEEGATAAAGGLSGALRGLATAVPYAAAAYTAIEATNSATGNATNVDPNKNPHGWWGTGFGVLGGPLKGLFGRAGGGPLYAPGPKGKDSALFWGADDEHVWTADEVDATGGHAGQYALRGMARAGMLKNIRGYADGGGIGPDVYAAHSMAGTRYSQGSRNDCCLIGSTLVYGPNGAKPISELVSGDEVYAYSDRNAVVRKVIAAWQSKTQPVFRVRTRNRAVVASANHPFMVLRCVAEKRMIVGRGRGAAELQRYDITWSRLDELQRGDLLVQPRDLPTRDAESVLPDGTRVTDDVAWLLGTIIGDGTVSLRDSMSKAILLCLFGEKRERAARIVRDTWTKHVRYSDSAGLTFNKSTLVDALLASGFEHRGVNKRIPKMVWNWPEKLQRSFLDGYCDADGHRPVNRVKYGDRTYHSCSRRLIDEVRALHIMLGDRVSNVTVNQRTKPITIRGRDVRKALPLNSFAVYLPNHRYGESKLRAYHGGIGRWLDENDFTVSKILDITPMGVQETYDITVEDDHNFVADGVVVHNSGMVGRVVGAAVGVPNAGLPTTQNMGQWLASLGFRPGTGGPGTISVGWYNHGPNPNDGHAAMTLSDGENAEAGGLHGDFRVGAGAAGANSSQFDHRMYLPNLYGEGPASGGGGFGGFGGGFGGGSPQKVAAAQEQMRHLDAEIANAEQRKSELKTDAKQSQRDRLDEEIRHLHVERDQAQDRLTKAQQSRMGVGLGGLQFGAPLSEGFGLSGGIKGVGEWITTFLANLAIGPIEGAMLGNAIRAGQLGAGLGAPGGYADLGDYGTPLPQTAVGVARLAAGLGDVGGSGAGLGENAGDIGDDQTPIAASGAASMPPAAQLPPPGRPGPPAPVPTLLPPIGGMPGLSYTPGAPTPGHVAPPVRLGGAAAPADGGFADFVAAHPELQGRMLPPAPRPKTGAPNPALGSLLGVPGHSSGALITGPGARGQDSVLSMVAPGEFVEKTAAVDKYGPGFMSALNDGQIDPGMLPHFDDGGQLPKPPAAPQPHAGSGKAPGPPGAAASQAAAKGAMPPSEVSPDDRSAQTPAGVSKPGASQRLADEGLPASQGIGFGGGLVGAAEGAAAGAGGMGMPGVGSAMQAGFQMLNRTAGYVGQLGGIALEGVLGTLLPSDSPLSQWGNTLPGKLLTGIAGVRPSAPNTAGQTQQPLQPAGGDTTNGDSIGSQMNIHGPITVQANNPDDFHQRMMAEQKAQYNQATRQNPSSPWLPR